MNERLLDVKTLADYLNVNPSWVYRQTENGKLPMVKVGKYNRYELSSVMRALRQTPQNSGGERND